MRFVTIVLVIAIAWCCALALLLAVCRSAARGDREFGWIEISRPPVDEPWHDDHEHHLPA
jgi:hypothetical protein